MSLPNLQLRRDEERGIIDVSCQYVNKDDLPSIADQMRRTRFPDEGPLILDLSFNELVVSDTPTLVSMLSHHPQLVVRVAHNKMNFAGLLHLAINDGGGPILHRYLREGRLTMASTDAHSIIEKIQLLQLSAATTLTEKYEKLRGWQNHEDFAIEDEVSHALAEHLRSSGCTVSDDDVPLHVLGVNGKHIYSFDCALMSVDLAGVSTLFLGEVKHYLTSSDITTAASKVKRLCERFRKLRDNKMPYEGPPLYIAQLHFYKALIDESRLVLTDGVKLFVGGTRINEDAVKLAAKCSYPIVAVNGGRFGVTAPCDVQELAHEEKDDEEV